MTLTGRADRDGSVFVYYQRSSVTCFNTSEDERNNGQQQIYDRHNLGPGESFTESTSFSADGGTPYRLCGYLGDPNDTIAPDARADLLVCAAGNHAENNACVSDTPPPSGGGGSSGRSSLKISAPSRAKGKFRVKVSWTASDSDENVILYAQPRSVPCYRTGEGERNNAARRKIKRIFDKPIASRDGSKAAPMVHAIGAGATAARSPQVACAPTPSAARVDGERGASRRAPPRPADGRSRDRSPVSVRAA